MRTVAAAFDRSRVSRSDRAPLSHARRRGGTRGHRPDRDHDHVGRLQRSRGRMMTKNVSWKAEPDQHDYPAAAAYLSLLAEGELVTQVVAELQAAPLASGKAKDLLRASRLPTAPARSTSTSPTTSPRSTRARLGHRCSSFGESSATTSRCRSPTATTGSAPATTWPRTLTSPTGWPCSIAVGESRSSEEHALPEGLETTGVAKPDDDGSRAGSRRHTAARPLGAARAAST